MRQVLWIYFLLLMLTGKQLTAHTQKPDTLKTKNDTIRIFSQDSLRIKASRKGFTRFMYKNLFHEKTQERNLDLERAILERFSGKTIASLSFRAFDVFGPTFGDTTRVARSKFEQFANRIHITTNPGIIRKNVLFEPGDKIDPGMILENERIIRALPYIRDVMFVVTPLENDTNRVDLTVMTKDVFSFGVSFDADGVQAGGVEVYNQNIWGIGHEASLKIVGHLNREPYVGVEGFYTVRNIAGHFVDIKTGYASTYKREGGVFSSQKDFLLENTRWAGGFAFYRFLKSNNLYEYDRVSTDSAKLSYALIDYWNGYSILLNRSSSSNRLQLVITAGFRGMTFYKRPELGEDGRTYYSGSKLFMGSISLARRTYIRDRLIYSYGITEDIPRGFLHELAFGYDNNEFTKRWYAHLYFSTGNIVKYRPSYLFVSAGVGSYFNAGGLEQGQLEVEIRHISRLFHLGETPARQFATFEYMCGINRFADENLQLRNDYGIRGLSTRELKGKQRLVLNLETVVFKKRSLANFNFAFFGFTDFGIIGSDKKSIFKGDYYAGIGAGMRVKNEFLVFRTLELSFAYYPNFPSDASRFSVDFRERGTSRFYSFQPRKPEPLRFE